MEEKLREELKQIWLECHDGKITKEERRARTEKLVHAVLEENPQRLLDLCVGHISGLSDKDLLRKARENVDDFVFMNISVGSYHYETIVRKSPHPDSRKIKKIFRDMLKYLGLEDKAADRLLKKTAEDDEYKSEPALTLLDILIEADICASLDWKFALEDVEYNLNLIAEKLNLAPIKEYPPYEEGQPLGYEALKQIAGEIKHAVVAIFDGDSICVFLTTEEKAPLVKAELDKLEEYWDLEDAFIVKA